MAVPTEIQITNKKDPKNVQVLTLDKDHAKAFLLRKKAQHNNNFKVTTKGWDFDYKTGDFYSTSNTKLTKGE